ncbi:hypothetical protein AB0G05_19770 [Nonomuraea wenchangensis]
MTVACNVLKGGPAGPACGEETAKRFVVTCAHRHLEADEYCARHAEWVFGGRVRCTPCGRAGHDCVSWPIAEYDRDGKRYDVRNSS